MQKNAFYKPLVNFGVKNRESKKCQMAFKPFFHISVDMLVKICLRLGAFPTSPTGRWVSGSPVRGPQNLYAMLSMLGVYVKPSCSYVIPVVYAK